MKTALLTGWWLLTTGVLSSDVSQPRAESARLIIYRQKEFGGTNYILFVNNKRAGTLTPNHYIQIHLPPGRTRIEAKKNYYYTDPESIWLTLQPGRTHYVKAVEEIDFMTQTLLMAPIGEEQARQELRRIKPADVAPSAPNE